MTLLRSIRAFCSRVLKWPAAGVGRVTPEAGSRPEATPRMPEGLPETNGPLDPSADAQPLPPALEPPSALPCETDGPAEVALPSEAHMPSDAHMPSEGQEMDFGDFLSELGATPVEASEESALALKEATISALEQQLRDLRGLGDELARTERARLAAVARGDELERRLLELEQERAQAERLRASPSAAECGQESVSQPEPESHGRLQAQIDRLQKRLDEREQVHRRTAGRLGRMRLKCAERHATAADRWRLIQSLRREKRELAARLAAAREPGPERGQAPGQAPGSLRRSA